MDAPFTSVMGCSLGTAAFQALAYTKSADGVYNASGERTGTAYQFRIEGELVASDAADLAAVLAAFETAATADGADLTITTGSGDGLATLESLAADDCAQGPRVSFAYGEAGPLHRAVTITVTARVDGQPADGVLDESMAIKTSVSPEGLRTLSWQGEVATQAGTSASAYVLASRVPPTEAGWVRSYDYDADLHDEHCSWSASKAELLAAYPSAGNPPSLVVDGERTVQTDWDEHNRQVTRLSYAYVGPYALAYIEQMHATLRAGGQLLRASISQTAHKTQAVTGQFETLAGRDGSSVIELVETVSHSGSGPLLTEVRYPGTTPLIVQAETAGYLYVQAGRAVGQRVYPQPPPPLLAVANYAARPKISLTRTNDSEFETAWEYAYLFADEQDIHKPSQRGDSPGVY